MSALYTIDCNDCGLTSRLPSRDSLASARRMARSDGWTHPTIGKDYCRECSEARAKRQKEENPNGYL